MALTTRLTQTLGIEHPILLAPMGTASGGKLAAAVSAAGGLGLIGGGYGDADWLDREFKEAGNARVGCGFITWSMAKKPFLLDQVLAHAPAALMLSFGSPAPFAAKIKAMGVPLICQVQTMAHAREAVEAGADIVVAQGAEAGGHGVSRATLTLVPEVADYLRAAAPQTLLVAAGGIADGRGLAAALMLGADGVLMGTRLWASSEALVPKSFQAAALAAGGDDTVRTTVVDLVRKLDWPEPFTGRVLKTRFPLHWHGREEALRQAADQEMPRYFDAVERGDVEAAGIFCGEAAGLIHDTPAAADLVHRTAAEAEALLSRKAPALVDGR
jgi:nitronate monooxygenase